MRATVAAVVLCVPIVTNADLILKYDATVSGIENVGAAPNTHSVGDSVSGHLIIDTDLAGPDRAFDRNLGGYSGLEPGGVDFITGRPHARRVPLLDRILVTNDVRDVKPDGRVAPKDAFELEEGFYSDLPQEGPLYISPGRTDGFLVQVTRFSTSGQLFDSTALEQTFDATSDEGTFLTGWLNRSFGGAVGSFRQTLFLTFSHVSLGMCPGH